MSPEQTLRELETNDVALHALVAFYTCDLHGCGRWDGEIRRLTSEHGYRNFTFDQVTVARKALHRRGLVTRSGTDYTMHKITDDGMRVVRLLRANILGTERRPVWNHLLPWFRKVTVIAL